MPRPLAPPGSISHFSVVFFFAQLKCYDIMSIARRSEWVFFDGKLVTIKSCGEILPHVGGYYAPTRRHMWAQFFSENATDRGGIANGIVGAG